jgi:LuxR family maltose regulon positive regulatory protein
MACGTAYAYDDQLDLAIQNYVQARDLALKAKNPFLATSAIEMLAGMQIYHLGHLQVAEKYLQQVLDLGGTDDGGHQTFTGTAHILLAEINLENNNLDIAASYLAKGMELLQQGGIGYSLPFAHCADARLKIATGDNAGAVTALQLADQAAQAVPLMHIQIHNLACQVKLAIHLRDVDTASQWASGEIHATPDNLPVYLYEVQQIALARVYLAQGDWGKTTDILDHITHQAEAGGRMVQMIEICILKALAFEEQGQVPLAVEALKVALSAAAPAGFRRKFIEAGQSTRKLLQLAATKNIQPQFVNELLAAFNGITPQSEALIQSSTAAPNQKSLVDPLTERECEVLKLIAAGCTNQQIADELVVSLNTVKKHTTHIYGKLDVQNRTEAANYARELGLV